MKNVKTESKALSVSRHFEHRSLGIKHKRFSKISNSSNLSVGCLSGEDDSKHSFSGSKNKKSKRKYSVVNSIREANQNHIKIKSIRGENHKHDQSENSIKSEKYHSHFKNMAIK